MRAVLEPGEHLGRYEVEAVLGRGGMGVVYKVRDPRSKMAYAAKVLHWDARDRRDSIGRFKTEARIARRLVHMNVVHVFELKSSKGALFYIMELVEGVALDEYLETESPLPLDRALAVVREVAAALQYVHSKRYVHRDVKPGNVLVRTDGHLKLGDFGLAQKFGRVRQTRSGHVLGTAKYMAPELIEGTKVYPQTDIYALGVMTYELIAGKAPFEADSTEVYMDLHLYAKHRPLLDAKKGTDRNLSLFVDKMLAKSLSRRVPSAQMVYSWMDFYLVNGFFADLPHTLRDY